MRDTSFKRNSLPEYARREIQLTDGGVYDNLGVEPIWSRPGTLLVSDASRPFASVPSVRQAAVPRLTRSIEISIEQVGAVRRPWLVDQFQSGTRPGTIWTLSTRLRDYPTKHDEVYSDRCLRLLEQVRTDLNAFSEGESACLENHGYALADAAVRSYASSLCAQLDAPFVWPYSTWCDDATARAALANSASRHLLKEVWSLIRNG